MRKCKVLHITLLTLLLNDLVPNLAESAFDAPEPAPINFALANLITFDNISIVNTTQRKWRLSSGGARLYGMPEIQPFRMCLIGPGFGGELRFKGYGLKSGAYSEYTAGFGYQRMLHNSFSMRLEFSLLQLAIKNYGSAMTGVLNTRLKWQLQPEVVLTGAILNVNRARIGTGNYHLPQKYAIGGAVSIVRRTQFFIELEKDTRYALQSRFGMSYNIYNTIKVLFGFGSEPAIVSGGLSFLIGEIRATAAYQYHPDLGISQCYGLLVSF